MSLLNGLSRKYDQEFREAERYARKHELNIWGDPELAKKYLKLKSKWGQYRSKDSSPPATVQRKEWKYVASRTSKVFHRTDCKWAKRISPKNFMGFKTREEAIRSGRRPCRSCGPWHARQLISRLDHWRGTTGPTPWERLSDTSRGQNMGSHLRCCVRGSGIHPPPSQWGILE